MGALLCAATIALNSAAAQDMNAAIDKAVQKYAPVKTLSGKFDQVNVTALGNTYNLKADFQQQFPNLVAVDYSDPKGDRIVADGKFTWVYMRSVDPKVVNKFPANAVGSVNLLGVFLDQPRTKYTLSDSGRKTIAGVATRQVGLVPKQKMAEFQRATVWIEEATGIIRQFAFIAPSGQETTITFTELAWDKPVAAARFKFAVPSGTRVVEGG